MIEADGLTKIFGRLTAVDKVSVRIQKGEIFGLVGPDGAGKTTLIRMLCGILAPTAGAVTFPGGRRPGFGYMPQRFSLYGDLTVMENISFYGALFKIDKRTIVQRAGEILSLTNLFDFKDRFADNLSGGMKQKLSLTCALVARPEMLILDEPTYGVDPESRKEFWKILYQLNKEGITIIVSTPYMDEAELCKKIAFMDGGRMISVDTPKNLKDAFPHKILELKTGERDLDFINDLPQVIDAGFYGDRYHVVVDRAGPAMAAITELLSEKNIGILRLEEISPSMEDVFIAFAGKGVV